MAKVEWAGAAGRRQARIKPMALKASSRMVANLFFMAR